MIRVILIAALVLPLGACGSAPDIGSTIPGEAGQVLAHADHFEVYSLNPTLERDVKAPADETDTFHGYKILGRHAVEDRGERESVLALVAQAVNDSEGIAAACFNPRHGVRARRDGRTCDLVICFQCLTMYVYEPNERRDSVLIARTAEPGLSALWRGWDLPIAK